MTELALKLAAHGGILAIAAVGWGLEHRWRNRQTPFRRRWAGLLFVLIFGGSIVNGGVTWHSHRDEQAQKQRIERIDQGVVELVRLARERDPSLTEQEALREIGSEVRSLRERTSKLERELEGVKRYGDVAKLNGLGLSGRIGPGSGLKETTAISRVLEEAYLTREVGGQVKRFPNCGPEGLAAFRQATEINPDFPFGHWALAICARNAEDAGWQGHAERAVTILQHTTQIAGHHGHHDEVLEDLRSLLAHQ